MRVGEYQKDGSVVVKEREKPRAGTGEILVKVVTSGICGSDVLDWYRKKTAPRILGHEIAGDIVEVGEGVKKYTVGQRVFVSHHIPCNTCHYCLNGYHTACDTLHSTNYDPGGFSEYIRVPALNVDRGVFPLPEGVSYEEGAFIEPLACVIRGQRVAALKPGQSVLVLGAGISGLLHLLTARTAGAGRLMATDINDFRLEKTRALGFEHVTHGHNDIPTWVQQVNNGRKADLVIVCAGSLPVFQQALNSVDRGGTVLCFAAPHPDETIPVPMNEFWRNEIKLMPSYGNAPQDAEIALHLIREKRLPLEEMITHRLPMDRIDEGFNLMRTGENSLKVIIYPQD